MKKFFEAPRTPNQLLAKLMEEVGEVAEAHSAMADLVASIARRAENGPTTAQRKRAKKAMVHLDMELQDVIRVAQFWRDHITAADQVERDREEVRS